MHGVIWETEQNLQTITSFPRVSAPLMPAKKLLIQSCQISVALDYWSISENSSVD
jgi:hypothetical protein